MIRFEKGSHANNLLLHIAMAGEYPYRFLKNIPANLVILQRTLLRMKNEGYITTLGSGNSKTIRITKKSFEPLQKMGNGIFEHYLSITDNHHFRGNTSKNKAGIQQTARKHRLAEVMTFFWNMEVPIFPYQKPEISIQKKENKKTIKGGQCFFYTALEIKRLSGSQRLKVDFTRILGALFTANGPYCVYNTGGSLMKWNQQGEQKAQFLVGNIQSSSFKNISKADKAIVFCKNFSIGLDILQEKSSNKTSLGFEPLNFKNLFQKIHLIPLNDNGYFPLFLILQSDYEERIKNHFFSDWKNSSFPCDFEWNKKFYVNFFDFDIGKLKKLKNALDLYKTSNVVVNCFSSQEAFVREYLGESVSISLYKEEELAKLFR